MNKKGQALVEFILILPIILLVIITLIDIGNIFIQKISLNNSMQTVTELYQNEKSKELLAYVAKEDLEYSQNKVNDMIELTLKKKVKLSDPVLSSAIGKNYEIKVSKTIFEGTKDEQ